jgi:hypothetical protein
MRVIFADASDRHMIAGALRLYADDCRRFADLGGSLSAALMDGYKKAENLAAKIDRVGGRNIVIEPDIAGTSI